MKRTLKFAAMLLVVVAVIATGCHKEPQNGDDNGGGNGGNGGGGNEPTPTMTTYTVTFNANGGSGTMQPQTFTKGEAKALTANAFTYQYHTFVNWNTMADGSGTAYTNQQQLTLTENLSLYAQWQRITYTVTFESNGGTGEMLPQVFNAGEAQSITSNSFTKNGYVFCGWYTTDKHAYSDGWSIEATSDMILYARWYSANGDGATDGHNYVDLGLPSGTLWATCNVGANTPTDYGDYFAWGETQPQADNAYSWESYKYANGTSWDDPRLTKYCNNSSYGDNGFTDNLTTLEASDDAATANWGAGWRMPTDTELGELTDNCTVTWTTQNGINGRLFTGSNGNSLFLPAAGRRWDGSLYGVGSYGYYWSSSLTTDLPYYARNLYFYSGDYYMYYYYGRYNGFTVRPVCSVSQK